MESVNNIGSKIAELDRQISAQIDEIVHHADFQRLEASWRGLHYLVERTSSSSYPDNAGVRIKVLQVHKSELVKDFEKTLTFEQSELYEKVYREVYNTYGSDPFGALIGDYEFTNDPKDFTLLTRISEVAAEAHAPFISSVSAQFFGWDSFQKIIEERDVSKILDGTAYTEWHRFRESQESRFVGLTLPRVLMREPYGKAAESTETFSYEENVIGEEHSKYLWGNSAYVLGTRLTEGFSLHGVCADIRGIPGGMIQHLPSRRIIFEDGEIFMRTPLESWTQGFEMVQFWQDGFIPIIHDSGVDYLYFFATPSVSRPRRFDSDTANSLARISVQLQYIFVMSRFAHYLMVVCRDRRDGSMTRKEVEMWLQKWISQYVFPYGTDEKDFTSEEQEAKYPLGDARMDVHESPNDPDVFRAAVFLRPRFLLEEPPVSLRIVVRLQLGSGLKTL